MEEGRGKKKGERQSTYELTVEERELIDEVKAKHPQYRHRRIQGRLQQKGIYLSASAIVFAIPHVTDLASVVL